MPASHAQQYSVLASVPSREAQACAAAAGTDRVTPHGLISGPRPAIAASEQHVSGRVVGQHFLMACRCAR